MQRPIGSFDGVRNARQAAMKSAIDGQCFSLRFNRASAVPAVPASSV
jgi:hypothetical protein